jgi:SAM-dependent methyltransferase
MPLTDPTQRFSSRVDNYIRYRPGYPPEVLATLKSECGLSSRCAIADVGSGTGLLSRIFLENGNRVYGVEPNQEMREAGERILKNYPQFISVAGTAEATTLPGRSLDLVTAAQAAHWFDSRKARREFVRILKPGGWVVLIWNERKTDSTPFLAAYEALLLTYGTDYHEVRHERTTSEIDRFFAPARFTAKSFEYRQDFEYEALEGRLLSSSYTPQAGDARHVPMLKELRRIFEQHKKDGRVGFEYNTRMYYGQLT